MLIFSIISLAKGIIICDTACMEDEEYDESFYDEVDDDDDDDDADDDMD